MHFLNSFFPRELVEGVGWALFHSLWQATIIAAILFAALYFMKSYSANVRYLLSYAALITTLVLVVITGISAGKYAHEKRLLQKEIQTHPEQVVQMISDKLQESPPAKLEISLKNKIRWLKFRAMMQRNFPVIFGLWFLGVLVFLLRMTGGMIYQLRLRKKHVSPFEAFWQEKLTTLKSKMGIRKKVLAVQSTLVQIPMLTGYLKPLLIFPVTFFTGLNAEELEAVIAHELAHIKRHDYLLNIIQSVIETLFFYHPAVWLISRAIREEREHSCDDLAVELTGDKLNYIRALATSQEMIINKYPQYAVALSSKKGSLLQRVNRIKNHKTMKKNVNEGFFAAAIIFISLILVSFTFDGQGMKTYLSSRSENQNTPKTSSITKRSAKEKHVRISFVKKEKVDSVNAELQETAEKLNNLTPEMEQLMELAYTVNDSVLSRQIAESINCAMKQVDMKMIMQKVDSAISGIDMNRVINQAMETAKVNVETNVNVDEITRSALEAAQQALNNIDINAIVNESLEASKAALENVDIQAIMKEALEESKAEMQRQECLSKEQIEKMHEAQKKAQEALKLDMEARDQSEEAKSQSDEAKLKSMEDKLEELEK